MANGRQRRQLRRFALLSSAALVASLITAVEPTQAAPPVRLDKPTVTKPAAFDTTAPLRDLASSPAAARPAQVGVETVRPEVGRRTTTDRGHSVDTVVQSAKPAPVIPGPMANFEGLSNQDNFNLLARRVNPPDAIGDIGPNHYVEMVNLVFAVYSKTGAKLLGPLSLGSLWAGFAVPDCTDNSGDPVVMYDQYADRWILTQFTTRGNSDPTKPFYNCVAVSTTGDPTGSYYRYAFTTGFNFPDYPKYGIWDDTYLISTREFGNVDDSIYGIGVYGLERDRMIAGDPNARAVSFLLQDGHVPLNLIGDGLLPADADGKKPPKQNSPTPLIGTQDDDAPYGATIDAVNVWNFNVTWDAVPTASIGFAAQLPTAPFDSIFPCGGQAGTDARDCLPQPGITDKRQFLDVLSYRQRPTWRLAFRTIDGEETMVTNQAVEAQPGLAGTRWYEIRRNPNGKYRIFQQGTYAPNDTVHRWMGSIAQDRKGNAALGYSVVNATDVFPGIRYTGRLADDRQGEMTLGEATVVDGTGAQTTTNSRWGDYTSMNVDPVDDCTFWYVNEYYTAEGQANTPTGNGWQTRIASFKLPGC